MERRLSVLGAALRNVCRHARAGRLIDSIRLFGRLATKPTGVLHDGRHDELPSDSGHASSSA